MGAYGGSPRDSAMRQCQGRGTIAVMWLRKNESFTASESACPVFSPVPVAPCDISLEKNTIGAAVMLQRSPIHHLRI